MSFQTKINSSESQEKACVGFHKCSSCGKVFGQRDKLTRHVQCVHENLRPFNCPYCEIKTNFKNKHTYLQHLDGHFGKKKKYPCTICNSVFKNRTSFYTHFKTHEKLGEKPSSEAEAQEILCRHCRVFFPSMEDLETHLTLGQGFSFLKF